MASLVVVMVGALPVAAQVPPERADRVAALAIGNLRSPYCPGLMLEVCPSPNAEALRDSIRAMAAEGQSAERIVESVLARHGEEWRGTPRRTGAGLLAWLAPPAALALGMLLVWARMRTMVAHNQMYAPAPGKEMAAAERIRLDAALRDFDRGDRLS